MSSKKIFFFSLHATKSKIDSPAFYWLVQKIIQTLKILLQNIYSWHVFTNKNYTSRSHQTQLSCIRFSANISIFSGNKIDMNFCNTYWMLFKNKSFAHFAQARNLCNMTYFKKFEIKGNLVTFTIVALF